MNKIIETEDKKVFLLSSVFGKDNLFLVGRIIVIDPGHGGI